MKQKREGVVQRGRSTSKKAVTRDGTDSEYRVGPGHPPREHQFKPGQSGNPKGAKRKPKPAWPDVKALLEAALNAPVEVKDGDKRRTLTRLIVGLEQLALQFARGDRYARRDVFDLAERFGIYLLGAIGASSQAHAPTTAEDQAVIDEFMRYARASAGFGGEVHEVEPEETTELESDGP